MKFTDFFIKRPVLSTVVGLLILLLGVQGFSSLTVRELPKIENTVITVTTVYPGAPQELVQGSITRPIQTAMASAEGIDYLSSISLPSKSQIQAHIELDHDPNAALAEIMSKVAEVQDQLPQDAQQPLVKKQTGSKIATFYVGFYSDTMNAEQITEYLNRVVRPLFETVAGVGRVDVLGRSSYAMRVWLNPQAMAARQITPNQVFQALKNNNYEAVAGQIEGDFTVASITAKTTMNTPEQFGELVVGESGNTLIRIKDLAKVELGSRSYDSEVFVRGRPAVALQVEHRAGTNPLTVIDTLEGMLPAVTEQMPEGLQYEILLDQTTFIRDSNRELSFTLLLTAGIVVFVIFLFMGSFRAALIPAISISLSLVGVTFFMEAMGFSLNLLTLLAMVIAIGLIADDVIVVVENVQRHIDEAKSPYTAAILGAREIAAPVTVMTLTLAAVFAPMGLLGGPSGVLFSELAFTLAGLVVISGLIALTLSPMMSSRFLESGDKPRMQLLVERIFDEVRGRYERGLDDVLHHRPVALLLAAVLLASIPILLLNTPVELAPAEDKGIIMGQGTAPMYANIDYTTKYTPDAVELFADLPENELTFSVAGFEGPNTAFVATRLKPWDERKRSQSDIQMELQRELSGVAGMDFYTFVIPPLPGNTAGLPVQLVITNQAEGYGETYKVMTAIAQKAKDSGKFFFVDHSLRMGRPQIELEVKTDLAASLGISMAEIGRALSLAFGDDDIDYVDMEGRSYQVIPQVAREFRLSADMINQVYVPTYQGKLVPLGTVVELRKSVKPSALQQFNQLNSATISFLPLPWVSMGEAVEFLEDTAQRVFPEGFAYDFTGESRQYVQQGDTVVYAFIFAIILILLMLAAKFESWRDPLVVMLSLAMAVWGALLFMQAGASTLNVYSEIALLTLLGLISKQGALIVEFANRLQEEEGYSKMEAIFEASVLRLRPILMTSFAIVIAMIPLILASGAGASAQRSIGWVLFAGMSIGTCFTLFVLPVMYSYISKPKAPLVPAPALREPPNRREDDDTPVAQLLD